MDAARKSYEVQAQVRHNAEEFKNAINDLYTWQKDIKNQEKQMQQSQQKQEFNKNEDVMVKPIRSQKSQQQISSPIKQEILRKNELNKQKSLKAFECKKSDKTEIEKCAAGDTTSKTSDIINLKCKEANEIKDRGNAHVKLGAYQLAADEYTKAIDLYDQEAILFSNRAFCYLKMEKYHECINDCDRAIKLDNLAIKAYYRRMLANESLGNNKEALKDCTTILTIDPKNIEAKRSLDRINERLRNNASVVDTANFSSLRSNMIDILPIEKPPYKRSTTPLKRITITDVFGPKDSKNFENLKISDEDLDKLFNSNCGTFEEIKNNTNDKPPIIDNVLTTITTTKPTTTTIVAAATTTTTTISNNNKTPIIENIHNTNTKKPMAETITTTTGATTVETAPVIGSATNDKTKKIATESQDINDMSHVKKELRPLPPLPTSTAQFYRNWKDLPKFQKYDYFKAIPLTQLNKILGAGFDSDTLSDIISVLNQFETDGTTIANTLMELSKHRHLSILTLLMSNEERQVIMEIINRLKDDPSRIDNNIIDCILNAFNLK